MPVADKEVQRLRSANQRAQMVAMPGAPTVVVVPAVRLPSGWNASETTVRWVLSPAYPAAQPDCFFADLNLRLASGAMPSNSGIQQLGNEQLLWFSWHVQSWRPGRDDLLTYLRFIERRFVDAR